ncbi:hypothetical protein K492DRAFT_182421 [Lichtheimia hyalospora FSU 10163]|nr:hypothetical protein K492DRAFT_182421 [Lichtheimia hyalospora FSU 10163]
MLEDAPDSYWWIDVLCARSDTPLHIMGDIYACCLECIAMVDCEPNLIPLFHTMARAKEDFWGTRLNWNKDLGYCLPYKQLYDKKYPHLVEKLFDFMQSEWWQRVWTWQEMGLPFGDVRLMAETGTHRHAITLNCLLDNYRDMVSVLNEYVKLRDNEAHSARMFTKTRIRKNSAFELKVLMRTLGNSTRRCMNPVDYVYGVLGMLQIKIPRMKDPNAVWQYFLREFENYIDGDIKRQFYILREIAVISYRAYQVNLQEVEHMGDVYKDFLTFTMDDADAVADKFFSSSFRI